MVRLSDAAARRRCEATLRTDRACDAHDDGSPTRHPGSHQPHISSCRWDSTARPPAGTSCDKLSVDDVNASRTKSNNLAARRSHQAALPTRDLIVAAPPGWSRLPPREDLPPGEAVERAAPFGLVDH